MAGTAIDVLGTGRPSARFRAAWAERKAEGYAGPAPAPARPRHGRSPGRQLREQLSFEIMQRAGKRFHAAGFRIDDSFAADSQAADSSGRNQLL